MYTFFKPYLIRIAVVLMTSTVNLIKESLWAVPYPASWQKSSFSTKQLLIKHQVETNIICYSARYVDDILVLFDMRKATKECILHEMNQLHKSLEFKLPHDEENCINLMDLKIIRNVNQVNINVFQKLTPADTTIHFTSNHSIEYNGASYRFYIQRLGTLPLSQEHKSKE